MNAVLESDVIGEGVVGKSTNVDDGRHCGKQAKSRMILKGKRGAAYENPFHF